MSNLVNSESGAFISPCRNYRYGLWRRWEDNAPYVLFIGLNPSTANEHEDDPTIRRCKRFAADWGYGSIYMANLFAFRATNPKDMLNSEGPVGKNNDDWLRKLSRDAGLIVCAWGSHGKHLGRDEKVNGLLAGYKLKCLGVTKDGQPRHPLYIRADKALEDYGIGEER